MRYKDNLQRSLAKIENQINVLKHHSQRGEHVNVNQTIDAIKEIIELIRDYCSLDIKYTIGEKRKGDPSSLVADISKAQEVLNYRPDYDIVEIIRTAYDWHKNGKR